MVKNIILSSLKGNVGANYLASKLVVWLKSLSKIISPKLREVLEVAQNNYIINLLSIFKKDQYNVVCSSKELIIIDTDKKNFNDCQLFASYIQHKVNGIDGL